MRKCEYCGRWFKNKQAVRAHLRFCTAYLRAKATSGIEGKYLDAIPDGNVLRTNPEASKNALWRQFA